MQKCEYCGKWFKNKSALAGHKAHCVKFKMWLKEEEERKVQELMENEETDQKIKELEYELDECRIAVTGLKAIRESESASYEREITSMTNVIANLKDETNNLRRLIDTYIQVISVLKGDNDA